MKIKTRKTNCYPGDKTIQIIVIDNTNRSLGLMNLTRYSNRFGVVYENDLNTNRFNTITEAKQWCKDHINDFSFGE